MTDPSPNFAITKTHRKPNDEEIDVYGLTHQGKVRKTNQDHFLVCSLHKQMQIHFTSLTEVEDLPIEEERLAYLAMVADGVGSGERGEEASRLTVQMLARYISESLRIYYTADATDDQLFTSALQDAAVRCHEEVVQRAAEQENKGTMATTLTLWLGVWPMGYIVQVGDSRCYAYHDGKLTQITQDQTMAEELVSQGVLSRSDAFDTRWAHVLSSSIGGEQTAPVVTRIEQKWGHVGLICSDGLTKHVSDERIRERISKMTSAKQVCEDLLQDALDDGGSDNITIIVGRPIKRV